MGMTGAGKSEAARAFAAEGFAVVRFGDITDMEIAKRGLELNEANERLVREDLRRERGMAAYAELNLPRIDGTLAYADVVIDGLYSWEEYTLLKGRYGEDMYVAAVLASPRTRYKRLACRGERGLTEAEASSRDLSEIELLNKGGPIAMADFAIVNESALSDLEEAVRRVVRDIR